MEELKGVEPTQEPAEGPAGSELPPGAVQINLEEPKGIVQALFYADNSLQALSGKLDKQNVRILAQVYEVLEKVEQALIKRFGLAENASAMPVNGVAQQPTDSPPAV